MVLYWLLEWQAVAKQCRSAAQQGWADMSPVPNQWHCSQFLFFCVPWDPGEWTHSLQRDVYFGFLKQFWSRCWKMIKQSVSEITSDEVRIWLLSVRITLCGAGTRCLFGTWLLMKFPSWGWVATCRASLTAQVAPSQYPHPLSESYQRDITL